MQLMLVDLSVMFNTTLHIQTVSFLALFIAGVRLSSSIELVC